MGTPQDATDADLIARIARGDRLAMHAFFGRHQARVYRFALRLVENQMSAEDIAADVFIDVWRNAARFEARSSVSTWLLAIARNKAYSALRRRKDAPLDEEAAAAVEDPSDDPEVVRQKQDKGALMRACLSKLSPEHREVIDLVYYHEKSVAEVAEITGAPQATVKTRMFYARKRLSELFAEAGIDPGMAMSDATKLTPREELDALVPWYVAGALDEPDRRRLERAMTEDPAVARSVEAAREEQAGVQTLNETLPGPGRAMAQRVLDAIDATPARVDLLSKLGQWALGLFAATSPRLVGATVAAVLALFAMQTLSIGGLLWRTTPGSGFQTASGPGDAGPAVAIVRFPPDMTMARIQDRLLKSGLTIASGPTAEGFFRLRAMRALDAAGAARLLDELRADRDTFALVLPASPATQ